MIFGKHPLNLFPSLPLPPPPLLGKKSTFLEIVGEARAQKCFTNKIAINCVSDFIALDTSMVQLAILRLKHKKVVAVAEALTMSAVIF